MASILVLQISATNIAVADRVESLSAGADTFLVEPVQPEELEAVTRALLRLHHSERALREAVAEREMLLKEVNHRVKNSLQLVLSMLSLQSHEFADPQARGLFSQAIARVSAIASVHERLYQEDDPMTVNIQSYLHNLCAELERAGSSDARSCLLKAEIDPVSLPTEHGVSLGLMVNELVMNALKYGRPADGQATIAVRLKCIEADQLCLTVEDNGKGGATGQEQSGLGTRLIGMLVRQLKGELQTEHSSNGHRTTVLFPQLTCSAPS
jgi:two-component sensor histidine kinase